MHSMINNTMGYKKENLQMFDKGPIMNNDGDKHASITFTGGT